MGHTCGSLEPCGLEWHSGSVYMVLAERSQFPPSATFCVTPTAVSLLPHQKIPAKAVLRLLSTKHGQILVKLDGDNYGFPKQKGHRGVWNWF